MHEHRRKSELQKFGETVVFEHLSKLGYTCVFLGDYFPCFDIEAYKDGQTFVVSVKTRNHTTDKNEEKKDCYNLFYPKKRGDDPEAVVKIAAEIAQSRIAVQLWAAVRVDVRLQQYDAYWGRVADLVNKKQIPMSPSDRRRHRTLTESVFDSRIEARWSNVRRSRLAMSSGESGWPHEQSHSLVEIRRDKPFQ
jgi:hypothetical protein